MSENTIRRRAAFLLREDAAKSVFSAAADLVRMGEVNFDAHLGTLRARISAYDLTVAEATLLEAEEAPRDGAHPDAVAHGWDLLAARDATETPRNPKPTRP